MKIVVTADTHMPKKAKSLPSPLLDACREADLILHAGDWSTQDAFEMLSAFAPVRGVHGNTDTDEIIRMFPAKQSFRVQGTEIGMVHGHGERSTTERRALDAFPDEKPQIIVFGHSHIPYMRYFKKTLLLNPGSPTDKRVQPFFSFAVLELAEGSFRADFKFFQ